MQIVHGVYTGEYPFYRNTYRIIPNIPVKFRKLIDKKFDKFWYKFTKIMIKKNRRLEFTFGYDENSGISTIAIVHPKDQFTRRIGFDIVKGRFERMRGLMKNRTPYYPRPDYVEVGK